MAASNIVRLPTAASRRPDNNRYKEQRAAKAALRAASPWPGKFQHPPTKAEELAERLTHTPELLIVMMLLQAADVAVKAHVLYGVEYAALRVDNEATRNARDIVRLLAEGEVNERLKELAEAPVDLDRLVPDEEVHEWLARRNRGKIDPKFLDEFREDVRVEEVRKKASLIKNAASPGLS